MGELLDMRPFAGDADSMRSVRLLIAGAVLACVAPCRQCEAAEGATGWAAVPAILERIQAPAIRRPRLSHHELRRRRRWKSRLQAGVRQGDRRLQRGGRRPSRRAGGRMVRSRADPSEVGRQSARRKGRHGSLQHDSGRLSAGRPHSLRRQRGDEFLAAHLRLRAGEHRDHGRGHVRRPGRKKCLVALERVTGGNDSERAAANGRRQRAGARPAVRRRPSAAAQLRAAVRLPQRAHRRRHVHQFADVDSEPRALRERHHSRRHGRRATARTTTAAIPNRAATC